MNTPPPPLAPPAALEGLALAEWIRVSNILAAGGRDLAPLAAFLEAYARGFARWQYAEAQIDATGGPVVKAPSGFPVANPFAIAAAQALRQMTAAAQALDLAERPRATPRPLLPVVRHAKAPPEKAPAKSSSARGRRPRRRTADDSRDTTGPG